MKIEVHARRSGKTARCVEWVKAGRASEEDRVLLVETEAMAREIRREHDLIARECMGWRDFYRLGVGRRPTVRVENANWLVQNLLNQEWPHATIDMLMFDDGR